MKILRSIHLKPLLLLWLTVGSYFTFLFQNIILLTKDGLFFGHEYVWSDWPLHVAIANIFALKNPNFWFSYHPLYAQGKFTYPFLADLIPGLLMRFGIPLTTSFILPSVITVFIFITLSYFLFYLIFKSRKVAVVSLFIFLLSSGPGFLNFLSDFISNPKLENLLYPPFEYSKATIYQWGSGNVITGLLIPQRAFLLGITIGVGILLSLSLYLQNKIKKGRKTKAILIISGVLAGILPIVHPHSFIAIAVITGLMCILNFKKIRELSLFFIPATLLSILFYSLFIRGGIETHSFLSFMPGWTARGFLDFFNMWWVLWGLSLPIAIYGLFILYRRRDFKKIIFFSGFILIFVLANLIKFQPTAWDNSKLFFWSYFGFSSLCAFVIIELSKKTAVLKFFAILFLIFLTSTGTLEAIRLIRIDRHTYLSVSEDDLKLAENIRNKTKPQDRFLTGTTHNSLVMVWAARPILMGYAGWVQNFGFNYQETEQDIFRMYQGNMQNELLFKRYKIKYVLIGPWEKQNYNPNITYFIKNFPIVFSNKDNLVFKVN